ncbi:MAG TPA: hypothetical protein VFD62_02940 [Pyrinomonadaceae bacterium]|nr:hypothetical protein [Pyrinomonadaceae bacterium]
MPFRPTLFNELPQAMKEDWDPDVQIFFHGQLILRSPDGEGCDVAFNPIATDHVLTIEARIRKKEEAPAPTRAPAPAPATDLIRMRHLGPLNFRNSEAMLIEVRGGAAPIVPAAFKLIGNEPIDLENRASARPDDFRWILNVEGPLFHERPLNFPGFPSQNVIRLRRGEYYFKTAAHPSDRLLYDRSGGGKPPATFDTIGSVASASVFLNEHQTLIMRWRDGTRDEDRVLRLEQSDDTRYEIYIENTPLFLDTPTEPELPGLDEFIHYYKILDVPEAERFSVVPRMRPGMGNLGTPDVPCQVLTEDGPGGG